MADNERPAYYNVYPVQPVEISKYLGFCLGNVVKYILRAPFKGTPLDDCQKAMQYLEWEMDSPHDTTLVHDLRKARSAIERLREYLSSEGEKSSLQDFRSLYTQYFLDELDEYLTTGSTANLKKMLIIIRQLQDDLRAQ